MRNTALHHRLEALAVEASGRLSAELASGAEMPFEIDEARGGSAPLYCYRPLTGRFIEQRLDELGALPAWAPALGALAGSDALEVYLQEHGRLRVAPEAGVQARAVLSTFLACVFADRSEFGFEPAHFEAAYADLERALYEGHCTATVIAPVLGMALDPGTIELPLGAGLSLIRGDALAGAPADAVWGDGEEPNVLALLALDQERSARPPIAVARVRFRRILTALRLFERGGYAVGPVGWARNAAGSWRPVAIGTSGRPRLLTLVPAAQEDELRAFYDLVTRRLPGGGELAWALSRFEMGCERLSAFEALTDYLLALRALLEPEGAASGRLAQRLSVICASPDERAGLAQRTAQAISLERSVVTGIAPAGSGVDARVEELAENLRAILRDALCGHLDSDLRAVADGLLAEAVGAPAPDADSAPEVGPTPSHGATSPVRAR
ncbi:MAG: hypothetical protein M3016_03910 [Actinomycetota bacterium]|nr:hypothetical protein [Actinomycetota bacterium]